MKKLETIINPNQLDAVTDALQTVLIVGFSVTETRSFTQYRGHTETYRGVKYKVDFSLRLRVDVLVHDPMVDATIDALTKAIKTDETGEAAIVVTSVDEVEVPLVKRASSTAAADAVEQEGCAE